MITIKTAKEAITLSKLSTNIFIGLAYFAITIVASTFIGALNQPSKDALLENKECPTQIISLRFKADSTQPHQNLFVDGSYSLGTNIYLLGGKLYASTWKNQQRTNWISSEAVEDEVWHDVALVLNGAANTLSLYLDGNLAGSGTTKSTQ